MTEFQNLWLFIFVFPAHRRCVLGLILFVCVAWQFHYFYSLVLPGCLNIWVMWWD